MAAMHKHTSCRAALKPRCAVRPTLHKEAEGQGCSRILHPNRHKGPTLTLFHPFGCFPRLLLLLLRRLWVFTHTLLFKLRQFTSSCFLLFYIRSYLQTFFPSFVETGAVPRLDQGYPPRCMSAGGCHTVFSAASPSEMSCRVRKIVKPSQS